MDEKSWTFVEICARVLPIVEPIYDFGALQVGRQEGWADLRPLFPKKKFVGADVRKGPGVDVILNMSDIDLSWESVGTILCMNTLEHVEFPRLALLEFYRILKPQGVLIMDSCMNFPIHRDPWDFWRFTPEGFKSLLKHFPVAFVDFRGKEKFPKIILAIAFKNRETARILLSKRFRTEYASWKNESMTEVKIRAKAEGIWSMCKNCSFCQLPRNPTYLNAKESYCKCPSGNQRFFGEPFRADGEIWACPQFEKR